MSARNNFTVDFEKVKMRAAELAAATDHQASLRTFLAPNVSTIGGFASFVDGNTVMVIRGDGETSRLTASRIFINTGTRVRVPEFTGLDTVGYLTPESIGTVDQST